MIALLLLLAQDRVVYTDRTPTHEIVKEVRPAPARVPSPELLASLRARAYKPVVTYDGYPLEAIAIWTPWQDRPGGKEGFMREHRDWPRGGVPLQPRIVVHGEVRRRK